MFSIRRQILCCRAIRALGLQIRRVQNRPRIHRPMAPSRAQLPEGSSPAPGSPERALLNGRGIATVRRQARRQMSPTTMTKPKKVNLRLLQDLAKQAQMQRVIIGGDAEYRPGRVTVDISRYSVLQALQGKPEDLEREYITGLAHEIGHWLVAAPSRRKRVNYGIPEFPSKTYDLEEARACLVQKALEYAIGYRAKWPTGSHTPVRSWWRTQGSQLTKDFIQKSRLGSSVK